MKMRVNKWCWDPDGVEEVLIAAAPVLINSRHGAQFLERLDRGSDTQLLLHKKKVCITLFSFQAKCNMGN